MVTYSDSDAARDLRPVLDKAPAGAVNDEWASNAARYALAKRRIEFTAQRHKKIDWLQDNICCDSSIIR